MAGWVREWQSLDLAAACRTIEAPVLVVTGEAALDRVVPVSSTLEYLTLLPHAVHAVIRDTGHLGVISRSQELSRLIADFIAARPDPRAASRAVR